MVENLPMILPKCPAHDVQMIYHAPQTPEQKFVGAMYVCPCCGNSALYPSKELSEQLDKQKEEVMAAGRK